MKTFLKVLGVFTVLLIAGATWLGLAGAQRFVGPGPLTETKMVIIHKGASLVEISEILFNAKIIPDPYTFMVGVKFYQARLKAGEYAFPPGVSPENAMRILAEARTVVHKLTIAEGLTSRQVLALVQEANFLSGALPNLPAEGTLLPETWHLSRDDARAEVVTRMGKSMQQAVDQLWEKRAPALLLKSKEEAVILASIVERETAIANERPMVAAVFLNRMKLGMRLQSDPTVIYGLSEGMGTLDHPLTQTDLKTPHRWNTYVISGLPPTPIANPGQASLEAVLHPAATNALYFVADGSGGHVFAATLEEHNRNVANWRKLERP